MGFELYIRDRRGAEYDRRTGTIFDGPAQITGKVGGELFIIDVPQDEHIVLDVHETARKGRKTAPVADGTEVSAKPAKGAAGRSARSRAAQKPSSGRKSRRKTL